MPGTLLTSDWQSSVEDELHRHVTDAINQATQAAQNVAGAIPSIPVPQISAPTVNPQAVLDELNQHVQDIVQTATQVAQPAVVQLGQVQNELQNHVASVLGGAAQGPFTPLSQPQPQQPTSALGQPTITTLGGGSTDATAPLGAPAAAGGDVLGAPSSDTTTAARGPIDASSPSAFARSIAPYAQYAAQKLGIDPTWVAAMAASESNYGKAAGNELFGVKALPGQKGTTMMTHEGEYGGTAQNATFAAYDTPLDAVNAWIDLIQNHYKSAVGAQDLPSFIHGLKQGGYFTAAEPEYLGIVKSIASNIGGAVQSALQSGTPQGGPTVPTTPPVTTAQARAADLGYKDISQFGDQQLTPAEAYAACGPAAAVRFAERMGRQPTLREATDLAASVGWTPQSGMAGISSEKTLLEKLGVPTKLIQGPQWDVFAKEAQTGNPVTISTYGKNGGHYFFADGYNPDTGAFHVGQSGKDLRGGSEWMTPAQMEALMGSAQGALFADSPVTPVQSSAAAVPSGRPTLGAEAGSPLPQINVPAQQAKPPIVMGQNQPVAQLGGDQQQGLTPIQTAQDTVAGVVGDIKRAGQQAVASLQGQAAELGGQVQTQVGGTASQLGTSVRGATDTAGAAAQGAVQNAPDVRQTVPPVLGGAATTVDQVRQQVQNAVDSLPADATVAQVKQVIADTLGAAAPNLGFDDAELQRRRAALDQNEALAARSSTGQPGLITPSSVAGGLAQTAVGPAFGTVQSPEQIRQNTDQVSQALQDNNPVRDVLVVGGLTNTLIDQIVQNPLLFIPGAPMGEALTQAGSTIIGDLAPQLGATAARVSAGALNAGVQNALYEMGKADATPLSVGTAFLSGAGLGTVITGGPGVVADVGRAVLRRVPDIADVIKPAVSRFAGEELGAAGRPADMALQRARQAVEDLRARFPQMSPGALAASREGKALAALEAEAASAGGPRAPLPPSPRLAQALTGLDVYPADVAGRVRAWARSTDAAPEDVARTVEQWIAENPTPSTLRARSEAPTVTTTGFRAPSMGAAGPSATVSGTQPLTVASAARGGRPLSARPTGTTADRLDFLLDRGRYAPVAEPPIPRSPSTGARPLATTVTGETPLSVASSAGALDINPAGRRLTDVPSGTPADQLDYLLERGRHAPPGEQPTPTALERANTVRLAGLLSSTTTHLVNATGNLVNGATAIPQQVIASGFDAARVGLRGGSRQRYLGEVLPMIKSWGPGVINSVPDAVDILRSGVSPQNAAKLDHIGAGFRSDLLPVVGRILGKRGGAIADSAIEMPLRMLQASDVLFRGGATNAFTNSLAVRKALQEGFKGPALERRVGAIMANLERHPELVKEANDQAARIVFQEKREVPFIGRQARNALEGSGVLRFAESQILPFTKTPANITAQGMGLSPLGWASVVDAARSGNPGLALDRAARASLGTAAFGVAMWMGAHGLLTGAYPDDPQVRSTLPNGWREWSVRLPQPDGGAVYVPMQNFGAFGWPMAMASVATEASSQGKPMDPDQIGKAVTSMGRYVLDNTFLQGLSDATNALHDPERYGQKLLESEASSFVPYSAMGRELQRISGMVNRNPREGLQGILDAMAATNPLTAGSVPERTNALGDTVSPTVTGAAAGLLPIRAEVEQDDPTLKILRDNGVGVSTIASAINVPSGSVQLTEAEQEEFKKARGDLIKRYVASETRGADFTAARTLTARNKYLSDAVQRANRDAREAMITKWAADRNAWRARIEKKAVPEPYYLGGSDGG
jgi:hypothetical protein